MNRDKLLAPAQMTHASEPPAPGVRFADYDSVLTVLSRRLHLLERVDDFVCLDLHAGQVVCDCNEIFHHVYFPLTARFAHECILDDGRSIELATIGRNGFAGWPVITRSGSIPFRTIVTSSGTAFRCSEAALLACLKEEPWVEARMLQYIETMFAEMSQMAACARLHSIEQQVSCRLLSLADSNRSATVATSAVALARALGVTARSVRSALHMLGAARIVTHDRHGVTIQQREALEQRSCECYRVLRALYRSSDGSPLHSEP
jgi:CRP-like cAMP-binding protein